jgi:hypothetical protein
MKISFMILVMLSNFAEGQVNFKNMKSFHRNTDFPNYQANTSSIKEYYDSLIIFENNQIAKNQIAIAKAENSSMVKEELSMQVFSEERHSNGNAKKTEASISPKDAVLSNRRNQNSKSETNTNLISEGVLTLIPTIYSLDSFVCYIGNQKSIYSCSAWASAGIESIDDNIKKNKKYKGGVRNDSENFYSPSFIYTKAKELLVNSQCDEGIDLIDALNVLRDYGAPRLNTCGYFNNDFNCKIDNLSKYDDEAKLHKIINFIPVDLNIIDFKHFLSHNCAIALEINIDYDFIYQGEQPKWTQENPYIWKSYVASSKFGTRKPHSVICIGYNDNIGALLMVNSFGKNFGNNGFFLIDYDFAFKNGVIKQAYRLKTSVYDSCISIDKSKIAKINDSKTLVIEKTKLELNEGNSGKSFDGLKFQCVSEDFDELLVHLKIYNSNGNVIRKDISLSYGICTFFSYGRYNYYIELLDMVGPTTSAAGLFKNPPNAQLMLFKMENNKKK